MDGDTSDRLRGFDNLCSWYRKANKGQDQGEHLEEASLDRSTCGRERRRRRSDDFGSLVHVVRALVTRLKISRRRSEAEVLVKEESC